MPTVTDGLEPEESRCWVCLGRGRREDPAPHQPTTAPRSAVAIIPERSPPPEASASKEADERDDYHHGDDDRRYEHEKNEDPEWGVDHSLLLSTG